MLPTIASTDAVIDRDTRTITLTRAFAARRERIFEAWTQPDQVTCWWDPTGEPLAGCTIDLRAGGAFAFVSRNSPHAFAGTYHEITPPRHLVFEAMGAMGRVILDEKDGTTLLTVKITCATAEQFEQYLQMGVATGTARTLDNLVAYIGTSQTSRVGR